MSSENGTTIQQVEGVRAELSNISYAFRRKPKQFKPKIGIIMPDRENNMPGATSIQISGAFLDREIMPEVNAHAPEISLNSSSGISVLDMQQIDIGLGSEIAVGMSSGVAVDIGQAENAMSSSNADAPIEAIGFGESGFFEMAVGTAFSVHEAEIEFSTSSEVASEDAETEFSGASETDVSTSGEVGGSDEGNGESE